MYEMRHGQLQQQRQQLSHSMVQSAEVLQLDAQELCEYVQQQALENPMIDLDAVERPSRPAERGAPEQEALLHKLEWLRRADGQNRSYYSELQAEAQAGPAAPAGEGSPPDYLMSQLAVRLHSPEERRRMEFLVCSLDSRGYLEGDPAELRRALGVSEAEMERCLALLQSAEPAGVGARDVAECLQLQIRRRQAEGTYTDAEAAVLLQLTGCLPELGRRHFARVAGALGLTTEAVCRHYALLQELNPLPGNAFDTQAPPRYIRPDAAVLVLDGRLEVVINEQDLPRVSVSPAYLAILQQEPSAEVREYLAEKYKQAQWVQHCIEERTSTLRQVVQALAQAQAAFFTSPQGQRVPLRMKELADGLGIHESTVSRAVKNKYLQCARGLYPMSWFFLQQVASDQAGNAVTPEQAKARILALTRAEDPRRPLSDQKLAELLQAEGVQLSRRTVAKYRAELGLPDAAGRRAGQGA